eukprot:gnl/Chilomastix_caulleri/5022.p1 GENE.gnl/Chilomastix_caulleri/5022~~gnl/Chilomastix_caulleri/5022.p1  ORF type:complete len:75 (-),score=8.27 gnl/Chilomastix_caulleri/5022:28-252(-)
MNESNSETFFSKTFTEFLCLLTFVDKNDRLLNRNNFEKITKCIELPCITFYIDFVLLNTIKSNFIIFNKNSDWI